MCRISINGIVCVVADGKMCCQSAHGDIVRGAKLKTLADDDDGDQSNAKRDGAKGAEN